jgi:hypothetical protein
MMLLPSSGGLLTDNHPPLSACISLFQCSAEFISARFELFSAANSQIRFRRGITVHQRHAVAHLVEALHYKSEDRGFDSRWYHGTFSFTSSFRPHYGPGIDSASNRNEYQEYFLGVKAAGAYG